MWTSKDGLISPEDFDADRQTLSASAVGAAGADTALPARDSADWAERMAYLLCAHIARYERLAVLYSGGADSTLLLALAVSALPSEDVLALTVETPLRSHGDLAEMQAYTRTLGVIHEVLALDPRRHPAVFRNGVDRCYHCKDTVLQAVEEAVRRHGAFQLADGTIGEDESAYRPGRRALTEHGVVSPLGDMGLSKQDVHALSAFLGLPTAGRPSEACLATRLPYDTDLTDAVLARVFAAEEHLHALGFPVCRVRTHGDVARIEVPVQDIPALCGCEDLAPVLQALGYRHVAVDVEGLRSGSFDTALRP